MTSSSWKASKAKLSASAQAALNKVEKDLGGKDALIEKLGVAEGEDEKLTMLLDLLADPTYENFGLGKLCELAGVTMGSFFTFLRKSKGVLAIDSAMDAVFSKVPEVARYVMAAALPRSFTCPDCFSWTPAEKTKCTSCMGTGKITVEPAKEHWQAALEMAGLLKKNSGVQLAVQVNSNQSVVGAALPAGNSSGFRTVTDEILFGGGTRALPERQTVDAEFTLKEEKEEPVTVGKQLGLF